MTNPILFSTYVKEDLSSVTSTVDTSTVSGFAQVGELISPEILTIASYHLGKTRRFQEVVALALNILNVVVFTQKKTQSSATSYLKALSLAKIVYLSVGLIEPTYNLFATMEPTSYIYIFYTLIMKSYFLSCLGRFMYCLSCLVSLERFLVIAFPLQAKQFRIVRSPSLFILILCISQFVCNMYVCLTYEFYEIQTLSVSLDVTPQRSNYSGSCQTRWSFRKSTIYLSNPGVIEVWGVVAISVFVYSMLMLGLLINIFLVIALRRHIRHHRKTVTSSEDAGRRSNQERQTSTTILVSTFAFVLLSLPLNTNSLVSKIIPEVYGYNTRERDTYLFFQSVGVSCFIFSFSTDFIAYVILSSVYRSTLLKLLKPEKRACFVRKSRVKNEVRESTLVRFKDSCTAVQSVTEMTTG